VTRILILSFISLYAPVIGDDQSNTKFKLQVAANIHKLIVMFEKKQCFLFCFVFVFNCVKFCLFRIEPTFFSRSLLWFGYSLSVCPPPPRVHVLKFYHYCEVLNGWKLNPTTYGWGALGGDEDKMME
jgi:hypothetical protein